MSNKTGVMFIDVEYKRMVILRRRILAELSRIVRGERVFVETGMANKLIDRDEDIQQAAQAIKAIAHPLRLKILCVLGDQEISVQDIVDQVGTSQSNISQHLAILRDKGVLATRKDSNRVYYRIGDLRTLKLVGMMRDVFCVA
jgi:DNA-binding transcriptional ArsR family regulator